MTIEEFLDNLATIRNDFDWNIEPDTGWYTDGRVARRGWVRARPRHGAAAGALLDPLGAVCYAMTGKAYGEKSWAGAGRELGLEASWAADINAAADARTWRGDEGERKPVPRLQSLRRRLLDCLELSGVRR